MTPRRYGPFRYVPIHRRPPLKWPGDARVALWVNPNIEFFSLDDVMPGNVNERVAREHAKVPNVRNWSLRDYGNRVGVWRRRRCCHAMAFGRAPRSTARFATTIPRSSRKRFGLGWELMGHGQTNAIRINEMDSAREREAISTAIDRIEIASGTRPVGWLGPGLAETWNTLEHLSAVGIRYVCDWVDDDQPYPMEVGTPPMISLPYSLQANDVPAYFDMKASVPEFERILKAQFDTLRREGEISGRVMAIAVHPFVTGQPHRIGALDAALEYICGHKDVWCATAREIVAHYQQSDFARAERSA